MSPRAPKSILLAVLVSNNAEYMAADRPWVADGPIRLTLGYVTSHLLSKWSLGTGSI